MRIKTKLTLGVGLLFGLILLLSIVGAVNINALKKDTVDIHKANQNTLVYVQNMLLALEKSGNDRNQLFEHHLKLQESNITETGEDAATADLRRHFDEGRKNEFQEPIVQQIRRDLYHIMDLNMEAIDRKSNTARATAENAVLWIVVTGTLCFVIAFTLFVNLPSNIANPIKELSESIRQIAAENYSERVHFEDHNEFGQLALSFNTMAEKLEEYNNSNLATLMREKKRIETLINIMHDPVFGLDENLNVLFANEEAVKISGLNLEDLVSRNANDIALKNDLFRRLTSDLMNHTWENPSGSGEEKKPIKIFTANKESYFEQEILRIFITPTGENIPQLAGHVIILRNVTRYKELDFAKTNFLSTLSHEFKTPISSIKLSVQLLENHRTGTLNEDQKSLIDSIREDAGRLLRITGELLNITQVETGNIQLAIQASDPVEMMDYAIQATKNQANQKQVHIETNLEKEIPLVLADKEKTAWVLINLLSNAIRYSHDHARVHVNAWQENNQVHISVSDNGQGIAPQYLEKIFERYFRIPGSKKEGTGLGLAISKEFMEAQGGNISVKSEFGVGSEFRISLNLAT